MKILIATRNKYKLKESKELLKHLSFKLVSLDQLKSIPADFDISETGQSFKQNAILKAEGFGQKANLLTIADDSGLSIDHLNGQPGIYSNRFARGNFTAARKRILQLLKAVPKTKRAAQFTSVIALFDPQTQKTKTFTGIAHGYIPKKELGTKGFHYDPIFYSLSLKKTYAQASTTEKNTHSHRALAFQKLINYLKIYPYE
jgi:XTP/dITP diphosphohydrolase